MHAAQGAPYKNPREPAPVNPTPVASSPQYKDAYDRALPAARALPLGELITINIDVATAVTTVIGKLPQIRSFSEQIADELVKFDRTNIDQLETYTLATAHAHALYLSASAPPEAVVKLQADATALRDMLYSDAVALANRGLVSGARLGEFKGAVGYKNVAFDLLGLTALLREAWPQIQGNTALKSEELDKADLIGEQLVNAVGTRDQSGATTEVTQLRRDVRRTYQLRRRSRRPLEAAWRRKRRRVQRRPRHLQPRLTRAGRSR
jgi:hypothetical protein